MCLSLSYPGRHLLPSSAWEPGPLSSCFLPLCPGFGHLWRALCPHPVPPPHCARSPRGTQQRQSCREAGGTVAAWAALSPRGGAPRVCCPLPVPRPSPPGCPPLPSTLLPSWPYLCSTSSTQSVGPFFFKKSTFSKMNDNCIISFVLLKLSKCLLYKTAEYKIQMKITSNLIT